MIYIYIYIYLLLYIDDILITSNNMFKINDLKDQLSGEFEMKDLSVAKKIFGIKIRKDQNTGKLYLSQKKNLEKVLECFDM